jgi:prevent-host-death family protein
MKKTDVSKMPRGGRASVAEVKARLSEYVARARAGEETIITDRGRPVAKLAPLSGTAEEEGRVAELVRGGLARAPGAPFDHQLLRAGRPADAEGRSLALVLGERAEGW